MYHGFYREQKERKEKELGRKVKKKERKWRKSDSGSYDRVTTFTASRSHSHQDTPPACITISCNLGGPGKQLRKENGSVVEI
jgi:hypothetical protein